MGISLFTMNGSSKIDTVGCSVIMSLTKVGIEDMGVKIDCLIEGCNEETVVTLLLGIADESVIGMMIGNKIGEGADGIDDGRSLLMLDGSSVGATTGSSVGIVVGVDRSANNDDIDGITVV
jgi:hypothetical protein